MGRRNMKAITAHPIVDALLERYQDALSGDMPTYRNHVYRCMTYHQLLLGDPIPDFAALAWAVHDLGIWTVASFDYLGPSADLAALHANEFGVKDVDRARTLIIEHHRLRPSSEPMTETFRIADRIDVSHGFMAGEVGRTRVRAVVDQLPYNGFHAFLAKGLFG